MGHWKISPYGKIANLAPKNEENGQKVVFQASNKKNKTTLLSWTFEVGEIKVCLLF